MNKFLLAFAFFAAISCSDLNMEVDYKNEISGKWNWEKTEDFKPDFYYEKYVTPEMAGYTEVLVLETDGNFNIFLDKELTQSGQYEIRDNKIVFYNDHSPKEYQFFLSNGKLELNDVEESGEIKTYVKIKERP